MILQPRSSVLILRVFDSDPAESGCRSCFVKFILMDMPAQGGYNVSPDKREFFHSIRDMSGEEMKETKKDYAIFVDSSADLAPSLLQDGKLQMVAMSYTVLRRTAQGKSDPHKPGLTAAVHRRFYSGAAVRQRCFIYLTFRRTDKYKGQFSPCKPDTHRGLSGFPDHRDQFPVSHRGHRPSGGRSDREQGSRHGH